MPDYLIGYDIRSKLRLQKVHRVMMGCAVPIQYSIFFLTGCQEDLQKCIAAVKPLLKPVDDLRCYHLPSSGFRARLGTSVLPEGLFYSDLPKEL